MSTEIEDLDREIEAALAPLNSRQRTFCRVYAAGNVSQTEAAKQAGYSEKNAGTMGNRQWKKVENVKKAVDLISRKNALEYGVPVRKKREILLDIAEKCRTRGDTYSPGSGVAAVRLLSELDRDLDTVVNLPELAQMPLLQRQEALSQLVANGRVSLQSAKMLGNLVSQQIEAGQLKMVSELLRRVDSGEDVAKVARGMLNRLPTEM